MSKSGTTAFTRRRFLASAAATAGLGLLSNNVAHSESRKVRNISLKVGSGLAQITANPAQKTAVWAYNGSVPGPEIRVRQGDRLQVAFENNLKEETTVHWHGVRTPNAMDGVPHLTQKPIAPGARFTYEFDAVDAGTFWYHPHQHSTVQVGRGLYGSLIIEEKTPIVVDRDVTWILDDWRLTDKKQISNDFDHWHDISHNGRIGNVVTINGRVPTAFTVRKGERIRLRLINTANARIFGLNFNGHKPTIIALDGQPVAPHAPDGDLVIVGPAMRVDLILDMTGEPGSRHPIEDNFYRRLSYRLINFVYAKELLRTTVLTSPITLPKNPLNEPDLEAATRHTITFRGGMMGAMVERQMAGKQSGMMMGGGMGSMRDMMHSKKIWLINDVAAEGHIMAPMLTLKRGTSYILTMTNMTAWHHPIHMHGHSFRVISRNGKPTSHKEWQDTVLMESRERVEIAFVADNPGDWMFHCHILEHMAGGMMGVIRVT